jgi:hypothetical protein
VQISQSIGTEAGGTVKSVEVDQLLLPDAPVSEIFRRFIVEPLAKQADTTPPTVILVDGLELAPPGKNGESIPELILNTANLPTRVRFVGTTRPDANVLARFLSQPSTQLLLDPKRTENLADARAYIEHRLRTSDGLQKWLASNQWESARFISEVVQTGEGNFQRVRELIAAAERGDVRLFDQVGPRPSARARERFPRLPTNFVDRQEQLSIFENMLYGETAYHVLIMTGPSGIGKSMLLQQMRLRAKQGGVPTTYIDLRSIDFLDRLGIILHIAQDLSAFSEFPRLSQMLKEATTSNANLQIENSENIFRSADTIRVNYVQDDPSKRTILERRASDAFFADLTDLANPSKVLLLFDTFEQAPSDINDWIVNELCPRLFNALVPRILVVIASQTELLLSAVAARYFNTVLQLDEEASRIFWTEMHGLPGDVAMKQLAGSAMGARLLALMAPGTKAKQTNRSRYWNDFPAAESAPSGRRSGRA